mmetsp:Transcript_34649/g.103490  ORF Transcript_34649/g.103490 Transcript_34649/m.103490 type:complete len:581 (-) Transcript_34649:475-2217(-)|eukprot:CAMPEP_0113551482 /NCGR_PEP_ID=MMETSP0015_2-20120614/14549_1 /TAXON_ID=2838 /ORGANISM="Odontella" /LENGTH=580 /DNA_ID=CAMNT_0000452379 /DNA_START=183 /DNA_END=1925 /DNA_ORIENTATION=+ /assembly_acc=CAM_ASM_000160
MFRRKKDKQSDANGKSLDVALIGCGPGGMMFLHHINKKKAEGVTNLPNVTCFERAASPGGVWRDVPADDKGRSRPENASLMYDDLWSNTPKELIEFFDYTFDDHFKKPTPSFLPRKDILEYLVTRNAVDGALDGVKYNHTVLSTAFDDSSGKFNVKVRDESTGEESTSIYDRCIWAGGLHGTAHSADDIVELMKEFTGKVMHSLEAGEKFEDDVKGKKVLLVGDSYSAEDLALRALKLGAKHVYICARSGDGDASETKSWPKDKVTVIFGPPYKVQKGNGFKCQAVYYSAKKQRYRRDDEEDPVKVKDIDTVVLCTGYNPNLDCLDESIQFDDEGEWEVSKGWQMENNSLTISIGSPKPSKVLDVGSTCYTDVYRGLLISNPKMMFITETPDSNSPLMDLDVNALLVLGYLMGDVEIPKEKEMVKANQKQLEAEMQLPWFRMVMDPVYAEEVNELPDGHWSENADDERAILLSRSTSELMVKRLARDMKSCKYPVNLGEWKKLSKKGESFVDMMVASHKARTNIKKDSADSSWRTFRDVEDGVFASIHTETANTSLPGHWLDLEADKNEPTTLATVKDEK